MPVITGNTLPVVTALQLGDGNTPTGKALTSIVEAKVLKMLKHQNIGLYLVATAMNPEQYIHGGTALYRKPEYMQVTDYDATGAATQTPQMETLQIPLNINKQLQYEIESIDMNRLFETYNDLESIANAIVANYAEGAITSIRSYFDCQLLAQLASNALANAHVVTVKKLGTLDATITKDSAVAAYAEFAVNVNAIETSFSKFSLGVNRADIVAVLSPNAVSTTVVAGASMYPDAAEASIIEERIGAKPESIGTFGGKVSDVLIWRSPFLGQKWAAGACPFDKVNAYDFSKTVGFIFHRESVALPISGMQSGVIQNYNNLNYRFTHKFNHGIGGIRGSLVYQLVTA